MQSLSGTHVVMPRPRESTRAHGTTTENYVLTRWLWVPQPVAAVFPFFANAENLERITPPELGFRIRSQLPIAMGLGTLIDYTIALYRIPMRWRSEITSWDPPYSFVDTQVSGPYARWVHTHQFFEDSGGTTIRDRVSYRLPGGRLGRVAHPVVLGQLQRIFRYRETALRSVFFP